MDPQQVTPQPEPIFPPAFPAEPNRHTPFRNVTTVVILILSIVTGILAIQNFELRRSIDSLRSGSDGSTARTGAIPDTWAHYTAEPIGVRFSLPKGLGLLDRSGQEIPGETGLQFCMVFTGTAALLRIPRVSAGSGPCGGGTLTIGSVTPDYSAGREGGFGDYTGYVKKLSSFYPRFIDAVSDNPLPDDLVTERTNEHGVTYLLVTGRNDLVDVGGDPMMLPVLGTPGEGMIGALINTPDGVYSGFNASMKIASQKDRAVFELFLRSLQTTD